MPETTPPYCAFVSNFATDQLVHPLQGDRDIENPLLFREPTVPRDRFGQPDDDRRGGHRIRELRHPQHDWADTRTMALVRGSTSISYPSWPSTTHLPRSSLNRQRRSRGVAESASVTMARR